MVLAKLIVLFGWPDPSFFLNLFLYFFSPLLLLLVFALHILSDSPKKLGVDYVSSLEMVPSSILSVMGHFITNFAPKSAHVFFN